MKILAEISEASLGFGEAEILGGNYELRKSARAVLFNNEGLVSVQNIKRDHFHKLPGGGVEKDETLKDAVKREIKEEVGCDCEVGDLIGVVIEYRNRYKLMQISYCFESKVKGEVGIPDLEQAEINEGLTPLWLPLSQVIKQMESENPKKYEGKFILKRELSFLREWQRLQEEK